MEQNILDARNGKWINADLADYHVPTNADVHQISTFWIDKPDAIVQSARRERCRRNRHRRRGGSGERNFQRDRQTSSGIADYAR